MEINPKNTASPVDAYVRHTGEPGAGGPRQSEKRSDGGVSDRVALSTGARAAALLAGRLGSAPEVRQDRVAEIRRRLADGQYRVDSRRVADSMLSESLLDGLSD